PRRPARCREPRIAVAGSHGPLLPRVGGGAAAAPPRQPSMVAERLARRPPGVERPARAPGEGAGARRAVRPHRARPRSQLRPRRGPRLADRGPLRRVAARPIAAPRGASRGGDAARGGAQLGGDALAALRALAHLVALRAAAVDDIEALGGEPPGRAQG